ncbi:MAG: 3-phosphoshikimate 1-carboxyvinyltransferase [Candidatus Zixiibacteriota bacterium]
MHKIISKASKGLFGDIEVPGDKSISHRALIIGSMCNGPVMINNMSSALDCLATVTCLKQLGVEIERKSPTEVTIIGKGQDGYSEPRDVLHAHNSGTTMRLLSGLLAGQPFYSILTGDASLNRRPMTRVISPLSQMGAVIYSAHNNTYPPMTIIGRNLHPIEYSMPIASAQVKSAILIAGLQCLGKTIVIEKVKSRDHTERMLKYLSGNIENGTTRVSIFGGKLKPRNIAVPGDISSAVYYITAGLLVPNSKIKIRNVGINDTRIGFIKALNDMGATIKINQTDIKNEEPFGDMEIESSELKAINIGTERIPSMIDEIPLLALAATQAQGQTIISGARELRYKESDRLRSIATELRRLGANIIENEDGLEIFGPTLLKGAEVETYGDHRIVMTMAIAGLIASGETVVKNTEPVAISFPEFFNILESICGN